MTPPTHVNINPNDSQRKAIDHLGDRLLFISEEIWDQIPSEVKSKINDETGYALQDDESWLDEGHLVPKEIALDYLQQAGYFVESRSGNVRYLLTKLQENCGRIWSLEKLEKL